MKTSYKLYAAIFLFAGLVSCAEDKMEPMKPANIAESIKIEYSEAAQLRLYADKATGSTLLPMIKGESIKLDCKVTPDQEELTFPGVKWESNHPEIVSVDENGKLTAMGEGLATVTVSPSTINLAARDLINVMVSDKLTAATSISIIDDATHESELAPGFPSCYIGETMTLTAAINPEDATFKTVKWTSENPDIAAVDPVTGVVTGMKLGYADIKATALDPESTVSATHKIYIDEIVNPIGIRINNAAAAAKLTLSRKTFELDYETQPAASTKSLITWTSSNPDVVSVERGVLTLKSYGQVTITATCVESEDGTLDEGYQKSVSVDVNVPAGYYWDTFDNESRQLWKVVTNGAKQERLLDEVSGEYYINIVPNSDSKYRGDIKRQEKIYLTRTYSWLCVRMDDVMDKEIVTGRNITLDTSGSTEDGAKFFGGIGGSNNKWTKKYKCSDGSALLVYDLGSKAFANGGILPENTVATFGTFQFKYADIVYKAGSTPEECSYRMFWFRTFASEEEMNGALAAWSEKTGITYTE